MVDRTPYALVTGASSGIGRAFAIHLAENGYNLIIVSRSPGRLEEVADRLRAQTQCSVQVLVADLTIPAQLQLVERRLQAAPPVALLVNNAGSLTSGPFATLDRDVVEAQINLLVTATVRLTHAALEGMIAREQGTIVNISSNVAFRPHPEFPIYGSSKAFVNYFTRSLAQDPRFAAVRFLEVNPPRTRTEIFERAGYAFPTASMESWLSPEEVVDAAMKDLAVGEATSFPGEGSRDRVLRRLLPRRMGPRIAGVLYRLARP